jgi:nucleoside-diphosphate-sugar epimerase
MNNLANFILDDAKKVNAEVNLHQFKNASLLVTGASGLVGQYLLSVFANAANEGISLESLYLVSRNQPPAYLLEISEQINAQWFIGDVADTQFLEGLPQNIDFIVHAAGYGQPQKFLENELATIALNTLTTSHLLSKMNKAGKFIFISTSEIYSGSKQTPYEESIVGLTNTDHPRACYIEGKRCGEAIVNAYKKRGYDAKSIRLALAYGPGVRLDDKRVVNEIIKKGLIHGKIELLDSGLSARTYIYITDAVEFMLKILTAGKSNIYNLSGLSRTNIAEMAILISDKLKVPLTIPQSRSGLAGAPEDVLLSLERLLSEFPKKEFVDFDSGLNSLISWYRLLLSND